MRIVLLGAPGAGKTTQARFMSDAFGIPSLSTGDMLRAAMRQRTPLGLRIEDDMKAGNLISDAIVIELVRARLVETDCRGGWILDGFPRTLAQAEAMRAEGIDVDHVFDFDVPDAEIVIRMSGRRVHPASGRSYHVRFNPPRVDGVDDVTGEPLVLRDDDATETVLRRLALYRRESYPLGAFYSSWGDIDPQAPHFTRIDGIRDVDTVRAEVFSVLS
ncbi:adenylate kinase [uncultured Propionivibrio sp.]|uniref:adenylate kinase n=1 Tax=uncultured Propionivibrio sp. TaxID=426737 RepID=UPI0029C0801E|nr:adenylate kinase [uncultured Propionivibrio sp.]